ETLWILLSNVLNLFINSSYCSKYFPTINCKNPIFMKNLVKNLSKERYTEIVKLNFKLLANLGENSAFVMVPSIPQNILMCFPEPKNRKVHNVLHSCENPLNICSPDIKTKEFVDTVNMFEEEWIKASEDLLKVQGLHLAAISNYVSKKVPVIEILQTPSLAMFKGPGNNFLQWQKFMAAFIRQMKTGTLISEEGQINENLKRKIMKKVQLAKEKVEDEENFDEEIVEYVESEKAEDNQKSIEIVEYVEEVIETTEEVVDTNAKESNEQKKVKDTEKEKYIFCGGIDKLRTDKRSLFNYFSCFGEIISINVPSPHELYTCRGHINRGFAFIYFKSVQSVNEVLNIKPHTIDEKVIEIRTKYGKQVSEKCTPINIVAFTVPTEWANRLLGKKTRGSHRARRAVDVDTATELDSDVYAIDAVQAHEILDKRVSEVPTTFFGGGGLGFALGSCVSNDKKCSSVLFYLPTEKTGLITGEGGSIIKNIVSESEASITKGDDVQVFTICGTEEQIDCAKMLVTQNFKGKEKYLQFFRSINPPQTLDKKIMVQ
ncbi:unnamed protein product, partial [Meganyctiphanes norvegica]